MISTRGRRCASCIDHAMAKRAAIVPNADSTAAMVTPSRIGSNTTRMKNRPVSTSPNWLLSMMLQPCSARNVPTAPTMPGRSAQERRRMKRRGGHRGAP